jgi:hypothetical protein
VCILRVLPFRKNFMLQIFIKHSNNSSSQPLLKIIAMNHVEKSIFVGGMAYPAAGEISSRITGFGRRRPRFVSATVEYFNKTF